MVQAVQFRDNFYILEDERVRQFLIIGEAQSLLIDTGFPDSHIHDVVQTLTNTPVKVLMTHGDRDHTGGLADFGECWMHPGDWGLVGDADICLHPLKEGDAFSCGGYTLEVLEIPGHSYGSVAFLDRAHRLLLPGDTVQKGGPIYMFGSHRNLELYIQSLGRLLALAGQVDVILPCHHDCPIDAGYIEKDLQDALALKEGRLPAAPAPGLPCSTFHGAWTDFFFA